MRAYERLLDYVKVYTTSDPESGTHPSAAREFDLAHKLVEELKALGVEDARVDEHCYVYGSLPATPGCEEKPALGLIAHMDTAPDASGENVNPILHENYDGNDVTLPATGMVMKTSTFPFLKELKGETLITTNGTTLLGADDKAGVAEIMTMAETLLMHPEKKHGKIRIGFTPDEEVGAGADHFDVKLFGADYAYTVDGGALGELEYENFNAAGAKLHVYGRSVHPGSAKGKMKNAILIAQEFQKLLPVEQNPMYTEGYEGFFHLDALSGNVEETTADYIIRDHNRQLFEQKKELFMSCADFLNWKYGEGTVVVDMKDSYYNMREIMEQHMHLIDNAKAAMEELGIEPKVSPIRGGTDGARLSFMGLPCPNLCTGGENYHGRYEYACVQSMEKTTELLIAIAAKYANR